MGLLTFSLLQQSLLQAIPASEIYVKGKINDCNECGFKIKRVSIEGEYITRDKIIKTLESLSLDHTIHGIILQLPLPLGFDESDVAECVRYIDINKDIDCFTNVNIGRLFHDSAILKPCTPDGIMELLKYYDIDLAGKSVTIVNRSDIVGKPLAMMMTQQDATVTVCHTKTRDLNKYLINSDIIVVAVGQENFIGGEDHPTKCCIGNGAVVIDVGINRNSEGKVVGDVKFDEAVNFASCITPVPGGVGLTTRACLMRNLYNAYVKQLSIMNETLLRRNSVSFGQLMDAKEAQKKYAEENSTTRVDC